MKIGKITFDGYNNYGNLLQNYALQVILEKYATQVETIWHSPQEHLKEFWKWGMKEEVKYILNHHSFRSNIKSGIRAWELARRVRGMDFAQRYINIRYDVDDLRNVSSLYDYFVVGSDQVWNPRNTDISTAFLEFTEPNKRIAYAASIGAIRIPGEKKDVFKNGFENMHAISVREKAATDIIFELTGKKVELVLDPVFGVDEEKWRKIAVRPYWLDDKEYIFTYFLGNIPKQVIKFGIENGLKIINCFDKENMERYIISPEEWLYLIGNANFVCTDSFHATAFSIIFDRAFVVFPRKESLEECEMITRIESILNTFNVQNRLMTEDMSIDIPANNMNFKDVINLELKKSEAYLKNAFAI